jgi:hypothetical protein
MRASIEAIWRAPETGQARESRLTNLPGFCPAVYPPHFFGSPMRSGLSLSDQRFARKPEP